jgi:DNA polymerase-4
MPLVLHLDLDAFFCSVEEILDPTLKGIAFAVGGQADSRGVISTCSYEARKFGVRSAMPTAQAFRLCPHLKLLPGRHGVYGDYSRRVMAILADYSPIMQQMSVDEAYLDLTGDPRPGRVLAETIKARIRADLNLPCSLGLASNKLVAKIATNSGKPDGLVIVPPGEEGAFLRPMPLDMLWGVGPKTREQLTRLGMKTIGDLADWAPDDLVRRFGEHGRQMSAAAHGRDDRPVQGEHEAKSISAETTFARDVSDEARLHRALLELTEQVGQGLRRDGLAARTVKIKVRWPPFETITRQTTLPGTVELDNEIFAAGWALFQQVWQTGKRVRLIGIGVSGLTDPARQLSLFDNQRSGFTRQRKAADVIDQLREKYGDSAIQRASLSGRRRRWVPPAKDEERGA